MRIFGAPSTGVPNYWVNNIMDIWIAQGLRQAVLLPEEVGVRGECAVLDSLGVLLPQSAIIEDLVCQNFSLIVNLLGPERKFIPSHVIAELRVDLGVRYNAHFSPYTRVISRRDAVEA